MKRDGRDDGWSRLVKTSARFSDEKQDGKLSKWLSVTSLLVTAETLLLKSRLSDSKVLPPPERYHRESLNVFYTHKGDLESGNDILTWQFGDEVVTQTCVCGL